MPQSSYSHNWPIQRRWRLNLARKDAESEPEQRECITADLSSFRTLVLHGPAGSGKSFELKCLRRFEELDNRVEPIRLASVVSSRQDLYAALNAAGKPDSRRPPAVYLDSLDEALGIQTLTTQWLVDWLRQRKARCKGTKLRICSRSALWDPILSETLRTMSGDDSCVIAEIKPLDDAMVWIAAGASEVEPEAFMHAITRMRLRSLADLPLSLRMLLKVYKQHGELPGRVSEVYSEAVKLLASDTSERRKLKSQTAISMVHLLEAAERLACIMALSGRDRVDMTDDAPGSAISHRELGMLQSVDEPLEFETLRHIAASGLSSGRNDEQFGFLHRQVMEYLAGKRIACLPYHQGRALLASGLGHRSGVAGPLRETAAFAALHSPDLAGWIAEADPEVLGFSDVPDAEVRRRGTRALLEQFRKGKSTDSFLWNHSIALRGLRYDGAEDDLHPVLRDRASESSHALCFAIHAVEEWGLSGLSHDLAEIMLDAHAPLVVRESAGYAILRVGTPVAKTMIKPCAFSTEGDLKRDLRGIAIRCNRHNNMTVPELLEAISIPRNDSYFGAYEGVLYDLSCEGFDADGHSALGLQWVESQWRRGARGDSVRLICQRIAHRSLDYIHEPEVSTVLRSILVRCAEAYEVSPLGAIEGMPDQLEIVATPSWARDADSRRKVIELILSDPSDVPRGHAIATAIPGIAHVDEFEWLLAIATHRDTPESVRSCASELAARSGWRENAACVDAWLRSRERISEGSSLLHSTVSYLHDPTVLECCKIYHIEKQRAAKRPTVRRIRPSPKRRVLDLLAYCESRDPRAFASLCQELTLKSDSHYYHYTSTLIDTPGWKHAPVEVRARIVEAARRYLAAATDRADEDRDSTMSTTLLGPIAALLLLCSENNAWLEQQVAAWWTRWAKLILYDLKLNMSGEQEDIKRQLFVLVHSKAQDEVGAQILRIGTLAGDPHKQLFRDMLELYEGAPDSRFDANLLAAIARGDLQADRDLDAMRFVLRRGRESALPVYVGLMTGEIPSPTPSLRSSAMAACFLDAIPDGIGPVIEFMRSERTLARVGVERLASKLRYMQGRGEGQKLWAPLPSAILGEIVEELILTVPYNEDRSRRFMRMHAPDYAAEFRSDALNALSHRRDLDAVEALRRIEARFKASLQWLSRVRASSERAHRLEMWAPLSPSVVAEVLFANDRRLVRSADDVLDGIEACLERFEHTLQKASPARVESLWDRPRGGSPSPKEEGWVSDLICSEIRDYFTKYVLVVEREVQVRRRLVPDSAKGRPGSELDILVKAAPRSAAAGTPIHIPIEVKRSDNRDAKTAIQKQLVSRYLPECSAIAGVFILAWFDAPNRKSHKPVWPSIAAARDDLQNQAITIQQRTSEHVRVVVIDASLR